MSYLLHHLLEHSARLFPKNDAVTFHKERLTYGELNELADQLATVLRAQGVRRGDRVGIYINKSLPSFVSIQGILKTGAAYVPLDPGAPPERLAYIIGNSGIRCLLTSTRNAAKLAEIFSSDNPLTLVVLTDSDGESPSGLSCPVVTWEKVRATAPSAALESAIDTDLAYILYTSGSTGVPKGVMISHRSSMTFVNWAHETFDVRRDDRLSSHAPFHFDLSIFDIFVTLKAGATVSLVPEGLSTFPFRLAEWIENNHISIWYSVPSVLSAMVLHGRLERLGFADLRMLLFAGEVFPVKFLRQLMSALPHADFYNLYGPTETNVITYYKVPELPPEQTQPIPLGRACTNSEVFGVDEDGQVVTHSGQVGELLARGSGVAYGYWGDHEKTANSFVPNPLHAGFNERCYKTGDLITLDPDGNYLFLGRRDHMVKSRGYRIELGEIESALYSHPLVKEAAAIAVPDDLIGNRLRAFVVMDEGAVTTADELQRWCGKSIPAYMVPEAVEFRASLPKTSTEKVDKPALLASIDAATGQAPAR